MEVDETNDKCYRKVAFIIYTEIVNFRPQSKNKNHTNDWALGCPYKYIMKLS